MYRTACIDLKCNDPCLHIYVYICVIINLWLVSSQARRALGAEGHTRTACIELCVSTPSVLILAYILPPLVCLKRGICPQSRLVRYYKKCLGAVRNFVWCSCVKFGVIGELPQSAWIMYIGGILSKHWRWAEFKSEKCHNVELLSEQKLKGKKHITRNKYSP